ncbi:hypothetical protein DSO57_1036059 [Entomophthora muscae]|uniref:Uncharacterized protein n=1 Tax=Entomophthora muscae TaxID=34485 RepID=A0ACC2SNH5_9FUNG|nr:hypothetical protein DSO57_1036059 [Entomophthora muscae]
MMEQKASLPAEEIDLTTGSISRRDNGFSRKAISVTILVLATAYFIASLVITTAKPWGRVAIYGFVFIKVLFEFVPIEFVTKPIELAWRPVGDRISRVSGQRKGGIGGVVIVFLALGVTYGFDETELGTRIQRSQSMLGIVVFLTLMGATSRDCRRINWHTVATGILLQLLVGLFVMRTETGSGVFAFLSQMTSELLKFASTGSEFVLGQDLANVKGFAFLVLPGILFFSSFVQIMYYLGVMQWIITKSAGFFKVVMNTTVCESVVAAASPFVGMGESALLVKPYLVDMTRSELHQVMTSGFATIAGSVLMAFIKMNVDAKSLITSCVMSIPCSLALSKLRYPETEASRTREVVATNDEERESNLLHAAANGAAQGITLCLLIGGTLLAIISLLALTNAVLGVLGLYIGYQSLTLELIGSYFFWPFAWLIGIPKENCLKVGGLLATKLFANEFVAYINLTTMSNTPGELDKRSAILATYALCGFANFASIGIQVGCLGAMAPSRKRDLAELAMSAMITGTICTFVSAAIAGLLI